MASIKYTDEAGEHTGTLTLAEYLIYGCGAVDLAPTDRVPYFSWDCTDYKPFKRAVDGKYKTTCKEAWITKR